MPATAASFCLKTGKALCLPATDPLPLIQYTLKVVTFSSTYRRRTMSDLHNESIFITGGGSGLGWRWSSDLSKKARRLPRWNCRGKSRQSASAIWRTYSGGGRYVTCYADYQRAVDQILTRSGSWIVLSAMQASGITMPHWLISRRDARNRLPRAV